MKREELREHLLDNYDNIRDVFRYGLWWQRAIVIGVPLFFVLFITWVRPLPGEIPEKIEYWDSSVTGRYADGAVNHLDQYYTFVAPDGNTRTFTKRRWLEKLRDRYGRFGKAGITTKQTTTHDSFYWWGWWTLKQTVAVEIQTSQSGAVQRQGNFKLQLTWIKNDHGWFVSGVKRHWPEPVPTTSP